jgi:hypothetical protein
LHVLLNAWFQILFFAHLQMINDNVSFHDCWKKSYVWVLISQYFLKINTMWFYIFHILSYLSYVGFFSSLFCFFSVMWNHENIFLHMSVLTHTLMLQKSVLVWVLREVGRERVKFYSPIFPRTVIKIICLLWYKLLIMFDYLRFANKFYLIWCD